MRWIGVGKGCFNYGTIFLILNKILFDNSDDNMLNILIADCCDLKKAGSADGSV